MSSRKTFYSLILTSIFFFGIACQHKKETKNLDLTSKDTIEQQHADGLKKWKNMKFGMFIHWGVYSIPAGVWKGKQIEKLGEQIMRHADISVADYENIATVRRCTPPYARRTGWERYRRHVWRIFYY